MAKIVIFGAGDIARLAHFYFSSDSEHNIEAFAVDKQYIQGDRFLDLPLVPFEYVLSQFPPDQYKMFVGLSYKKMNKIRADKYREVKKMGYELVSYVSSRCSYLSQNPVGENCFILEDNTIQPYVQIGNNVTLWSGNHIGHDSVIEDHNFISSHVVVSGHVRIESYCFLGVNATLRNSITIGTESLIGAGAAIMADTTPGSVIVPPRAHQLDKKSHEIDL